MHNQAFKHCGLHRWTYVPLPVNIRPTTRIKDAILGLRALGFKGANVTVPFKEAVIPYLDSLSENAKAIGAVNTIVIDEQEQLIGHNTDGLGFIRDLADHGIEVSGLKVMVLGAGGSARAIVYELLSHGCKNIIIANRTKEKALKLSHAFHSYFKDAQLEGIALAQEVLSEHNYAD